MSKPPRSSSSVSGAHREPVELAAGGARGRERDDLARPGSRARAAAPSIVVADDTGGADHTRHAHRASCPSGRSCVDCRRRRARTPRAARAPRRAPASERITHEILIGEVEIISMLMSCSASVSNTFAATPGCERIPAPTIETLPICRVGVDPVRSRARPAPARARAAAARRSSLGDRERHLGVAPLAERLVLDDRVDVAVGVGERREDRGRRRPACRGRRAA